MVDTPTSNVLPIGIQDVEQPDIAEGTLQGDNEVVVAHGQETGLRIDWVDVVATGRAEPGDHRCTRADKVDHGHREGTARCVPRAPSPDGQLQREFVIVVDPFQRLDRDRPVEQDEQGRPDVRYAQV